MGNKQKLFNVTEDQTIEDLKDLIALDKQMPIPVENQMLFDKNMKLLNDYFTL